MALREVEVRFLNGNKLVTSMAAHLTDKEIRAYYRVGKTFNVGAGEKDRMTKVKSVRILR